MALLSYFVCYRRC